VSAYFSSIKDPLLTTPTVVGAVFGSSQVMMQLAIENLMLGLIELMKEPDVPALMFFNPSRQLVRVNESNYAPSMKPPVLVALMLLKAQAEISMIIFG
jgi:hypothetical protein